MAFDMAARSALEAVKFSSSWGSSALFAPKATFPEAEKEPSPLLAEAEGTEIVRPVLVAFMATAERGTPLYSPEAAERERDRSPRCRPFRPPGDVTAADRFLRESVPGRESWGDERTRLIEGEAVVPFTAAFAESVPLKEAAGIPGIRSENFPG